LQHGEIEAKDTSYYHKYVFCCNRWPIFCNNFSMYCNICLNITMNIHFVVRPSFYCNKITNSRNRIWLSQYRGPIAMTMHIVAIYRLYCNKTCTYHYKTKSWQYARPITTNMKMVAILCIIATKCGCSNKNCCNRPDFL
jgi:hypothetical protein